MNFHAKSGICSSKNGGVTPWHPWTPPSNAPDYFFSYFVRTVHMNFHAKSGVCSSKNEWVMLNLVFGALQVRSVPCRPVPGTNLCIELRTSRQLKIPEIKLPLKHLCFIHISKNKLTLYYLWCLCMFILPVSKIKVPQLVTILHYPGRILWLILTNTKYSGDSKR